MAWTATFRAETSDFDSDVGRMKGLLREFGTSVDNTDKSLRKMATAFDPDRIMKAGKDTIAVIGDVKNVATLTDSELRRANTTIGEMIQKLERTKQTVPDSLNAWGSAITGRIKELDQAKHKTDLWGSAIGSVKTVAEGMVAGFTVDRVITSIGAAITSTVGWAGSLTDLSAKVDVSTDALQRWEFAGNRSGNTLDELVGAAQELSKRLAEGDTSTVAAVTKLGLSYSALKQMAPEQQFETVSAALAKVGNAGERTAAGVDLMGRTFKTVAPTVVADIKAVGDEAERMGAIVSKDTIEAMDNLGDAWGDLKIAGRSLIAEVLEPMVPLLNNIASAAVSVGKSGTFSWLQSYASATGNVPLMTAAGLLRGGYAEQRRSSNIDLPTVVEPLGVVKGSTIAALNSQAKAASEAARAALELAWAQDKAARKLASYYAMWDELPGGRFQPPTLGWNGGGGGLNTVGNLSLGGLNSGLIYSGAMGYGGFTPTSVGGGGFNWSGLLNLVGGGASLFGGNNIVGEAASGALGGAALGGGVSSMMSSLVGASVWGPLAPIAAAVGASIPFIKKLFAPSAGAVAGKNADAQIANLQSSLLSQYGSVQNIAGMGQEGAALAAAWNDKNVQGLAHFTSLMKDFTEAQGKAVEQQTELNEALAFLGEHGSNLWKDMQAAAEEFGINIGALGPAFEQGKFTDQIDNLYRKFELLRKSGADVGGVVQGMSDEVSEFVQRAQKMGLEVPEQMRPIIEELLRTGQLLDENGNKITDISDLKFVEHNDPLMQGVDRLIEAFEEMIETLAKKFPAAAEEGARGVEQALNRIPAHWKFTTDVYGPEDTGTNSFAGGSGGVRDFGGGTLALLHGREAVVPEAEYYRGAGGGFTIQPSAVHIGQRVVGEIVWEVLPDALRRAGVRAA